MIKHVPVFIVGVMFVLIGLEAALAPEVFVFTENNAIAFEVLGRVPTGLATILVGAVTTWEGWRGSKNYLGLFTSFLMCLFFLCVVMLPLFFGDRYFEVGPFIFRGYVNGISAIVWGGMAALTSYFYLYARLNK